MSRTRVDFLCIGTAVKTGVVELAYSPALRYVHGLKDWKYGKLVKRVLMSVSKLEDANPHFRYIV
jgi:hypothetical protein